MSLSFLLPTLPHQEEMVARPEFGRPAERRDEVPRDHAGRCPIRPRGLCWVREDDTSLFDRQTGDRPPGDLGRGPLKEGREEDLPQLIFYHLEFYPYVQGGALHKGPLLLEGLLQSCVCGLWVPTRHPS